MLYMPSIDKVIEQLESLVNSKGDLLIETEQGLEDLSMIEGWPKDYITFLVYSNGLYIGKFYDCNFYSLEEVLEISAIEKDMKREFKPASLVPIASYYGDSIYMDYQDSLGTVYYSLEGIDDPVSLNLSFTDYMQKCIDCRFSVFWDN